MKRYTQGTNEEYLQMRELLPEPSTIKEQNHYCTVATFEPGERYGLATNPPVILTARTKVEFRKVLMEEEGTGTLFYTWVGPDDCYYP